jgi:hypothetical protein
MTNYSSRPKLTISNGLRAFPLVLVSSLLLIAPVAHAARRPADSGLVHIGLMVSPNEISLGHSVTITWNAQNADICHASGAWSGNHYINGQEQLRPAEAGLLTYSISCDGPNGTATTSTHLTVISAAASGSSSGGGGFHHPGGSTSSSSSSSGGHSSSSSSSGGSSTSSSSSGSSSSGGHSSSSSSSGGSSTSSSSSGSSSSGGHSSSSSSSGGSSTSSSSSGSSSSSSSGGHSSSSSSSGGSSTSSSSSSSSGGSSSGASTAYIRQSASVTSPGQNALGNPQVLSLAVTLPQPTLVGSTILVFATESNGGNAGLPITVTDYLGNPFSKLNQVDDTSNAAWQSMFSFAAYNVPAGTETVTVKYNEFEWQGVLVVEVAGVSSLPLLQHTGSVQRGTATTTNAITSGLMTAGAVPGTVIGLSMATLDAKGAPLTGTGFTASTSVWNWNGEENTAKAPSALLEFQHFTNPGDIAATFTASVSADDWDTLAVFFPDGRLRADLPVLARPGSARSSLIRIDWMSGISDARCKGR